MKFCFAFLAVIGLFTISGANAADDRPNVLMILVDDLGVGDLSSYGATDLKSPHIDQLISRGMRFDNFYANSCVCSPTRAALLSGKYPDRAGVPGVIRTRSEDNWGYFDPNTVTLADRFHAGGYHTAIVGKWHLGLESPNTPNERGFDHFHGFLGDMMDDYYHHRRHDINYMRLNEEVIDPEGHATDLFTDWTCDYLDSRRDQEQPFFLYLAYNAPHTPIQPPQEWYEKVKQREPGMTDRRAKLVALIEHLDEGIGQVLDHLEELKMADNTLVVFSSDNGGKLGVGANNGPWRDGKGSMYEGGIRVSTCAVWPGKIASNSRTEFEALTMDLYPTLLEAAGIEVKPEADLDGRSFLPTLLGEGQQPLRNDTYFVRLDDGQRMRGLPIHALHSGRWKLVHNDAYADFELYDMEADPKEANDLFHSNRQVSNNLVSQMQLMWQRGGTVPWQPPLASP
ncbi:sulfatase-like hydrolase/transferase [Calycomorphotria hydatis]|uniref:Arylsulfatase n=1 Tax=Calycomorphotria hydatis TaxID=2528027 RepID=A0A517T5T6_9PLAN|nr:sulfatase-like hydrolase/transferase [Calycomorphotria hydatis]QDT63745.1 Arylsulfatase [Calycomorphotria hydatis]